MRRVLASGASMARNFVARPRQAHIALALVFVTCMMVLSARNAVRRYNEAHPPTPPPTSPSTTQPPPRPYVDAHCQMWRDPATAECNYTGTVFDDPDAPLLTIVMAGRNDNYGGESILQRFQISLDALEVLAEGVALELYIVEWNPVPDRPALADTIRVPKLPLVKFITVPPSIHRTFEHHGIEYADVLEHWAKNVGIRRARGLYVLPLAMDTVVTPEFWNKLRHGPGYLRAMEGGHPRALHRMVRIDAGESVPPSLAPIETATWLKNHIFRAWSVGSRSMRLGNYSSAEVQEGLQLVYRLSPAAILNYSEANGDFQLMTRKNWFFVRGYWECVKYGHFDSILLQIARFHDFIGVIHKDPMLVLHQFHKGGGFKDRHDRMPVAPVWDFQAKLRANPNGCNWGFSFETFAERIWRNGVEQKSQ